MCKYAKYLKNILQLDEKFSMIYKVKMNFTSNNKYQLISKAVY